MYVSTRSQILILGMISLVTAATALASNPSADFKEHLLTDSDISNRCRASIAGNIAMVPGPDGRNITQCELTYITMRGFAEEYQNTESHTLVEIERAAVECLHNTTQENCLAAGRSVSKTGEAAHANLAEMAEKADQTLASFAKAATTGTLNAAVAPAAQDATSNSPGGPAEPSFDNQGNIVTAGSPPSPGLVTASTATGLITPSSRTDVIAPTQSTPSGLVPVVSADSNGSVKPSPSTSTITADSSSSSPSVITATASPWGL